MPDENNGSQLYGVPDYTRWMTNQELGTPLKQETPGNGQVLDLAIAAIVPVEWHAHKRSQTNCFRFAKTPLVVAKKCWSQTLRMPGEAALCRN